MNFVAFGLILICCHAWAIEIDDNFAVVLSNIYQTNFKNFLEKYKSLLQNGNSGFMYGIPIRDPFIIERLPIEYNLSTPLGNIDLEGFLENLNLSCLASFNINSPKFKLINMNAYIDLSWPLITANTNYSLEGNVFNYDIHKAGNMDGIAYNFRTIMNVDLKLKGLHMQVQNVKSQILLEALNFNITGIYNDEDMSEIFSKTISDVIPKLIASNQNMIEYIINNIASQILNKYLLTITFMDLLKIISPI
ncbi:uncharacterized protein [Mycetomoellerius zeteki]|uniref:uncharacterized protein n=1 Tax=Mycetomoellerius zeteki TaxID=64791 RepID=UPI00084E8B32|nr:PREDICTED: uncharacterized protein LOC108727863 [Trachymyrmex zeteki]